MPAGIRKSFSANEDNLLIKYLAKYNPGVQGRNGNKVYQTLVQNEHNKWPWSSGHPAGGWRDRYTKNQSWFNKRIKEYQQKKGWPTENSHWINGTQKPKDSDVESSDSQGAKRKGKRRMDDAAHPRVKTRDSDTAEDSDTSSKKVKRKRKRASSADARQGAKIAKRRIEDRDAGTEDDVPATERANPTPRTRTHVPDIYPDIAVLDVSPDSELEPESEPAHVPDIYPDIAVLEGSLGPKPEPEPVLQPEKRNPSKSKPAFRKRKSADSDFFASVPPTPSTTTRPPTTATESPPPSPKRRARGLPKLIEGGFRAVFDGVRSWTGGGAQSSDDDSPEKRKEGPPPRAQKKVSGDTLSLSEQVGDSMEVDQQSEVAGEAKNLSTPSPTNVVPEKAEDHMEVEQHNTNGKGKLPQRPPRRPPQQLNAVASSSRVQLPASSSRWVPTLTSPPSNHNTLPNHTPHTHHPQTPPHSSRRHSPLQSDGHHGEPIQRSPSPLDWGSPTGEETGNAGSRPHPTPTRTPAMPSSKIWPGPFRMPSLLAPDNVLPNGRHGLSRHAAPLDDPSKVLARLSARTLPNHDRSIGSMEQSSLTRRSRAPSPPRTDKHPHTAQYSLASPGPPRTKPSSSRPQSGTPLEKKTNRRAQDAQPFIFKRTTTAAQQHPADEARHHSLPAAAFPRIDFTSIHNPSRPRQSLPPRPPSRPQREPLPRRWSLFSMRTPQHVATAPTSAHVSPVRVSVSASDSNRSLSEHFGEQAMMLMAKNHGFDLQVVRNVSARTGDLEKADQVLLHMRKTAEAAGEAALRSEEETSPHIPEQHFELRRHSSVSATRSPPRTFELRHRRQHSGATATSRMTATTARVRSPPSAPSSSQRKKRHQHQPQDEVFRPQPLERDVLADTEYSPPSGSRAGAFTRMQKKGRVEEGLQREQQRASGGGTLSAFSRNARMQTQPQARERLDTEEENILPPTQFATFAEGNVQEMTELERYDLMLAIQSMKDVARYMGKGIVPYPYH
ncbi:hypothetical protein C8R45DRAFT_1077928 [Mycena sanguinolenta]|nr:hypothetical protein C8R45DRAFT_1077928 [Mycena sanguinolenta]